MAAVSLAGCATTASIPIQDFKIVAGEWSGNVTYQSSYGTTTSGATWTINEDGTFVMETGMWGGKGTMRLEDGKILFFDGPRASGIATLHDGPEGRYLTSAGNEPGTSGVWRPAK